MSFSSAKHGVFSCDVDCESAEGCGNTRCLYKQKTLGVHIWYMGGREDDETRAQLALREELGPWYQPVLQAAKGTNCHTVWCRDFIPAEG